MLEKIFPTVIFWSAFVFSIGPFWIAVMSTAKDESFSYIYKHYLIYTIVSWFPQNFIIGYMVGTIGQLNPDIYTALHFVGTLIILWMALKIARQKSSKTTPFQLNWKVMSIVSWTNPKAWLTIPTGYLSATYTESLYANIVIFFLIGFPLFLIGVYLWGMIGRQGAKIAKDKIAYFNAALLVGFAGYLLWEGLKLLN